MSHAFAGLSPADPARFAPYIGVRLMIALAAGLSLAPSSALPEGNAGMRQVPSALEGGAWYSAAGCPHDALERLEFLADWARANGTAGTISCAYAGLRQITTTRWHLDLECTNGWRIELDINALSDGRLLVAQRPLGEACYYAR